MSTLSSSSTFAEMQAAYIDNASYAEDGSLAKARAFITACRCLLLKLPKRSKHGLNQETEFEPSLLRQELLQAQQYVNASVSGGGVRHLSVEGFRD